MKKVKQLKNQLDVVIPVHEKDQAILHEAIASVQRHVKNVRRVFVVSKTNFLQPNTEAHWVDESVFPFSLGDVAKSSPDGEGRSGWLFQQLLKFYAPLVVPDVLENVLVMDADLVWLQDVCMFGVRKGEKMSPEVPLYSTGIDFHAPYFEHMHHLLPGLQRVMRLKSGVIHHMVFNRAVLGRLFAQVKAVHNAEFWSVFLNQTGFVASPCSEYEIYFNFLLGDAPQQLGFRQLEYKNAGVQDFAELQRIQDESRNAHFQYINFHSYNK